MKSWKTGRPRNSGRPSTDAKFPEIVSACPRAMCDNCSLTVLVGYCAGGRVLGLRDRFFKPESYAFIKDAMAVPPGSAESPTNVQTPSSRPTPHTIVASTEPAATAAAVPTCNFTAAARNSGKPFASAAHGAGLRRSRRLLAPCLHVEEGGAGTPPPAPVERLRASMSRWRRTRRRWIALSPALTAIRSRCARSRICVGIAWAADRHRRFRLLRHRQDRGEGVDRRKIARTGSEEVR